MSTAGLQRVLKALQARDGKTKYGNKWSCCLSRHKHQSRAEADYCNGLLADEQAGRIPWFMVQIKFEVGPGIVHIVDFIVGLTQEWLDNVPDEESFEVHEVKGHQTKEWRLKYKLFRAKYPKIKYKIIDRRK